MKNSQPQLNIKKFIIKQIKDFEKKLPSTKPLSSIKELIYVSAKLSNNELEFKIEKSKTTSTYNFIPSQNISINNKKPKNIRILEWTFWDLNQDKDFGFKSIPSLCSSNIWLKFCTTICVLECNWNVLLSDKKLISSCLHIQLPQSLLVDSVYNLISKIDQFWKPVLKWTEYTLELENDILFSRYNFPNCGYYCKFSSEIEPDEKFLSVPSTTIFGLSINEETKDLFEKLKKEGIIDSDNLNNVDNDTQNQLADLHYETIVEYLSDDLSDDLSKNFHFYDYLQLELAKKKDESRDNEDNEDNEENEENEEKSSDVKLWSLIGLTDEEVNTWALEDAKRSNRETAKINWDEYDIF